MGKSKILKTFNVAVILLSFWFIGEKFWTHHNWLRSTAVNYELLITIFVCSIIYGLSEFLLSFAWRRLLIWCGNKDIPASVCNRIYGKSQIAKYIPGNIFHFMGRHLLGRHVGVKHIVLAGAAVYEILGLLSISVLISLTGMFIFDLGSNYLSLYQIILILITTIVVSSLIIALTPYLMSLRGIILPYHGVWDCIRNITKIYLFYFIFFLIAGLLLAIIVNIFLEINFIIATKLVVIFSIAWVAGFIVPGAPGGIGVREAVIIFLITPIIGEAQSVAIAIAFRLITLFGDVWFLIISDRKFYLKK
jgi:uncharacterized membrane protein YbhN (UPF0104 family)